MKKINWTNMLMFWTLGIVFGVLFPVYTIITNYSISTIECLAILLGVTYWIRAFVKAL